MAISIARTNDKKRFIMKSLHSGGRLSLPLPPFSFTPIERLTDGFCSRWRKNISGDGGKNWFFTESWGENKGLGEAPKSCTRKEHESATNSIAKRGQGAIAPCRVKGQRPLWGLGQRPNCSAGDQHLKRTQQRRRQRSVPASNFARPQTRPQAALPPRFREEPENVHARRQIAQILDFSPINAL